MVLRCNNWVLITTIESYRVNVFVLSEQPGYWNISLYSEELDRGIETVASSLPNEEVATVTALQFAREQRPSRVLKIRASGATSILAEFPVESSNH